MFLQRESWSVQMRLSMVLQSEISRWKLVERVSRLMSTLIRRCGKQARAHPARTQPLPVTLCIRCSDMDCLQLSQFDRPDRSTKRTTRSGTKRL